MATTERGQGRRWCFTLNNPPPGALFTLLPQGVKFVFWSLEKGESGTPHFQGYIHMRDPARLAKMIKLIAPLKAHWALAKGSEEQNIAYCSKPEGHLDGPWELGERSKQGERTDLKPYEEVCKEVASGKPLVEIALANPSVFVKHANGLMKLSAMVPSLDRPGLQVCFIKGKSGLGKTFMVHERFPTACWCTYGNSGIWFNTYSGGDVIIIDEFAGQCPIHKLLRLLQGYPCELETKGGGYPARYTKVILTANRMPETWYPQAAQTWSEAEPLEGHFGALLRRLGIVEHDETKSIFIDATSRQQMRAEFNKFFSEEVADPNVSASGADIDQALSPELVDERDLVVVPAVDPRLDVQRLLQDHQDDQDWDMDFQILPVAPAPVRVPTVPIYEDLDAPDLGTCYTAHMCDNNIPFN